MFEPEADGGLFVNLSNTNFVRVNLAGNYQDAAEQVADMMTDAQLRALATTVHDADGRVQGRLHPRRADARLSPRRPAPRRSPRPARIFDLAAAADPATPVFPFRAVVQAALTSPFFLYRTEIGAAGTRRSRASASPTTRSRRSFRTACSASRRPRRCSRPPTAAS